MAKKKERAFFLCPRWSEIVPPGSNAPAAGAVHPRVVAAIAGGQPVARSTLRRALLATRLASGGTFDIDAYIVDQRAR